MKKDELVIKEAIFAKVNTYKGKLQMDQDGRHEFSTVRTATCVVDEANNKAIDIETGEVFDVVRRIKGIIVDEDYDKILDGNEHILELFSKDWDKISLLYQLALKDRAKKIYKRYLENRQDEVVKVKKIGNKIRNKKSN